jgi:hypothetical protein
LDQDFGSRFWRNLSFQDLRLEISPARPREDGGCL